MEKDTKGYVVKLLQLQIIGVETSFAMKNLTQFYMLFAIRWSGNQMAINLWK